MSRVMKFCAFAGVLLFCTAAWGQTKSAVPARNDKFQLLNCDDTNNGFCFDLANGVNYEGKYSGHDEPAIGFYSHEPGSGNSSISVLTLPKDPPTIPTQDGKGGVFHFQLEPTFWFGMILCDSQSAPNFTNVCKPDTDENIFDGADPSAPDWVGHHPGAAFLELQFYPPGWIGTPFISSGNQYFAATIIFSAGQRFSDNAPNNADCAARARIESGNQAPITLDGVPLFPPDPLGISTAPTNPDLNNVLFMNPGDKILLIIHDTPDGLQIILKDLSTGQTGTMTAGPKSGFAQVNFQPDPDPAHPSLVCSETPYAFHPMYSTSNEHTRTPWAAHTVNVSFSDEIGHFEFCNAADPNTFQCTSPGASDPNGVDLDDAPCAKPSDFGLPVPPFIDITGCIGEDDDFDGVPYQLSWPGTMAKHSADRAIHAQPIRFTSPLFIGKDGLRNFSRVAFETNVIVTEFLQGSGCSLVTGAGCFVPPVNAQFYPFYTTHGGDEEGEDGGLGRCTWQLGGNFIPGTDDHFGGSATTGYGPPVFVPFQHLNITHIRTNGNRRILNHNPCRVDVDDRLEDAIERLVHFPE